MAKSLPSVVCRIYAKFWAASWTEQREMLVSCVDHWAARMSLAPDPAPVVADATIAACEEAIQYEVKFWNKENPGSPTTIAASSAYQRGQALFRVVQWRAGKCPLPEV